MVARPLMSSNLLVLALLLVSLAQTYGQVSSDSGGGGGQADTNTKRPLEPLEVSAGKSASSASASASRATTVAMQEATDSTKPMSSSVSRASASSVAVGSAAETGSPVDMRAPSGLSTPPMVGSSSSSSIKKSEIRTSATSGPNERATSSHSVHVSTSSSENGNHVHTLEAHHDGHSPPEIVEEYHSSFEPNHEGESEEEEAHEAAAAASASVAGLEGDAPWPHEYHLEPPKIIDYSADGNLNQMHHHQHHHHDDSDDEEDDDDHDDDDDDDDHDDHDHHRHHHKKYKHQTTTYVPRSAQAYGGVQPPPNEHVDETYIDRSDPSDPKKVHYSKEVKSHVGPNGESYQHQESKTSNSLGANPNSHSYHHSSSSSSYVSSHSGTGGGNYKHYEPHTLGVNQHHGRINKKHNNHVHHTNKPYQHQVQSQHGHYENNNFAPLPPLPSLPGMDPLFRFQPFPKFPNAPAMPSAWLDLAQTSSTAGYGHKPVTYSRGLHPTVHGGVRYGPDEAIRPKRSRLEKKAKNMKRHLSKLQAKRRERLEHGQYSELEDFL